MAHEHHGFELRAGFQSNAYHYQYARGAKGGAKSECTKQHRGDYGQYHKEERAEQGQAVAYPLQIFAGCRFLLISTGLKEIVV